jgi:HAD superfamily hydrolase (TIGR01549 family)
VRGVKVVLFDFDGPLCDLFATHSAEMVAEQMKAYLDDEGWLLPIFTSYTDTHQLLYDVAAHGGVPERIIRGLDAVLVEAERQAAKVAHPTEGAAELIELLAAVDRPIAITTNNSAAAVQVYLKERGLERPFGERIFGREAPLRMKPDPSCLVAAMRHVGSDSAPDNCLMIGDSERDLEAARRAGVRFLAYAGIGEHYRERAEALVAAGADFLVRDMREVMEAFSRAHIGYGSAHVRE